MISAAEGEGKATRCARERAHGEGGCVRRGRRDACGCHPVDQEQIECIFILRASDISRRVRIQSYWVCK